MGTKDGAGREEPRDCVLGEEVGAGHRGTEERTGGEEK